MPYFLRSFARASLREQPAFFQFLSQLGVVLDERARDPQSHGAGLAVDTAAGHGGHDVELLNGFGQQQRLSNLGSQCFGGEERLELAVIDGNDAFARPQEDAG